MATVDVYNKLSKAAKEEISKIVDGRENAIDMIANNYFGGGVSYSSIDVCSRFQVQNFVLNPNENILQQKGRNGWWQNEAYEPSSVNDAIFPLIEVEGTTEKWGEEYYSSFALKELDGKYTLRYPLDDDYTTMLSPFTGVRMSDANFNIAVRKIQRNLNVKIVEGQVAGLNLYKRSFVNLAIVKIKNTALKLVGRADLAKTAFKGKLVLASKTKAKYQYSNIEKIVKIYDELFRVDIARLCKYSKGKFKVDKDIKFASRLFADILMARITDYGDTNINKKVERCLSLQFANVLNRTPLDSEELKLVADLASEVVASTCERMGISTNSIIQRMVINGYQYPKVPKNAKEALLLAKERDYSVYSAISSEKTAVILPTVRQLTAQKPAVLALQAANAVVPSVRKKGQQGMQLNPANSIVPAGRAKAQTANAGVIQLGAPKIAGLLAEKNPPRKYNELRNLPSLNMLNGKTISQRLIAQLSPDFKQNQLENAQNTVEKTIVAPKVITKKSIEKTIDKVIIKLLSEKVVSINGHLNAKRYSAVGGKDAGEQASNIYSQVLSYYTDYVNTSKTEQPENSDTTTFYSRSKKLCNYIIMVKHKLIEKILDGKEGTERVESISATKMINQKVRELTIGEQNVQGYTLREFFKAYLEKLPQLYNDLKKIDEGTKEQ